MSIQHPPQENARKPNTKIAPNAVERSAMGSDAVLSSDMSLGLERSLCRRTAPITSPRREIVHFKTPHFAAEVHRMVRHRLG
jgi:hypothetical protein